MERSVSYGFFRAEFSGSPMEMVHLFRTKYSDRTSPFHFCHRSFALIREFAKELKIGKSHSYWLARFNQNMSFHFRRVFPLISEQSV